MELQRPLFSFEHYRLIYMHYGTTVTSIIPWSASSNLYEPWNSSCYYNVLICIGLSVCREELQHPLFYLDQCLLVYEHYRTTVPAIFFWSVSACLHSPWNCSSSYFPSISVGTSICTMELQDSYYPAINVGTSICIRELQYPLFSFDQDRFVYKPNGTAAAHIFSRTVSARL